jgi:hypothetical protein
MHPEFVVARIEGGLGNQLFQYAAARSLADRLQCDLALDLRGLEENGDRPFQLDLYRIRAFIADSNQLRDLPKPRVSRWSRVRQNLSLAAPDIFPFPNFWPKSFAFDQTFDRIAHPKYLIGYWQSEKYFEWNRCRLLKDIQLITPLPGDSCLLEEIRSKCSVALHIRRGDYVSNASAAQFHGLCDLSYYEFAIANLSSRFPDLTVFVFSDEPEWARKNLRLNAPTRIIDSHSAEKGYMDLELMRVCQHHVIANSSFSWWGAWLCQSTDQLVYAPKRWFSDATTNTSDVIPAHWIQPK